MAKKRRAAAGRRVREMREAMVIVVVLFVCRET
jgi:hypothetical protein